MNFISSSSYTCLCQVAGVSAEAIRTDADEGIVSDTCHTRPSIVAMIHITVVTWMNEIWKKECEMTPATMQLSK